MGLYTDHVVPRIINWTCSTAGFARWRARACEGLSGDVVEVGFGSGTNVPFYPATVRRVYAVDPSPLARKLAAGRMARSTVSIEHIGLIGERLQLDDESCDDALVAFTLCTVKDPAAALLEIQRVLKPGGALHFLEHGVAPDPSTRRWQQRLNGLEQRLADGCQLTRDPLSLVTEAGFEVQWVEQRYARGPRPWSFFSVGVALKTVGPH